MGLTLDLDDVDPGDGDLWSWHLPAWAAWCAISGQWRAVAVSTMRAARVIWHGLDYTAAAAGLTLAGIDMTPELWHEVRLIEAGAVKELNSGR